MSNIVDPVKILVADDDPDDRMLIKEALSEVRIANEVDFVEDGRDLLDYLRRDGKFSSLNGSAKPSLILLDLNMPRKTGHEALKDIRNDPALRRIPVVVLTTSSADEDVIRTYDLGVNSFIKKPVTFEGLIEALRTTTEYWFQIVCLPSN